MATSPTKSTNGSNKTGEGAAGDASLEEISAQIEALKADLAGLTDAVGHYGKGRYREARSEAERHARHVRSEAEDYGRQAQDFIRDQPATALGLASGVGFLIGLLVSRR